MSKKQEMVKIPIQGKDYIQVHERVMEFHRRHENGKIVTELIKFDEKHVVTKTIAIPDVDKPDRFFTGLACEKVGGSFINKTSALENCETSSVGRAVGFLNIGIDTSVASYEEVANAVNQQQESRTIDDDDEF